MTNKEVQTAINALVKREGFVMFEFTNNKVYYLHAHYKYLEWQRECPRVLFIRKFVHSKNLKLLDRKFLYLSNPIKL